MGNHIIGPAIPAILAVICIGAVAIYVIRHLRRRNPPGGHDK
jgi:hypothetical protein